jgi:hypothetical protein
MELAHTAYHKRASRGNSGLTRAQIAQQLNVFMGRALPREPGCDDDREF